MSEDNCEPHRHLWGGQIIYANSKEGEIACRRHHWRLGFVYFHRQTAQGWYCEACGVGKPNRDLQADAEAAPISPRRGHTAECLE